MNIERLQMHHNVNDPPAVPTHFTLKEILLLLFMSSDEYKIK